MQRLEGKYITYQDCELLWEIDVKNNTARAQHIHIKKNKIK